MKHLFYFAATTIITLIVFMPFIVTMALAFADERWLIFAIPYFVVVMMTEKVWMPKKFRDWLNCQ